MDGGSYKRLGSDYNGPISEVVLPSRSIANPLLTDSILLPLAAMTHPYPGSVANTADILSNMEPKKEKFADNAFVSLGHSYRRPPLL